MTFEFMLTGEDGREFCNSDAGGMFIANFVGVDDTGKQTALMIQAPSSGGDAIVQAGYAVITDELWVADPGVYDKLSGIQGMPEGVGATAEVSGNTISGSGVFYADRHLQEVRPSGGPYEEGSLEGTFSATCPAE